MEGLIVRAQSGFFTVATGQGRVICRLRGRLKQGRQRGDIAALGDRVEIRRLPDGSGVIDTVEPRKKALTRLAPTPQGEYQQVLIANPDQILLIFSCAQPAPHLRMLDRFLVIAEKENLLALVVANKVDLVGLERARQIFGHYEPLGYPVLYTSSKTRYGVDALHQRLSGLISAFTGPSGVGKSSLLNAVQPQLGLAVSDVSGATRKGRHTTVVREMYALAGGGYIADTPGIKALALWDTEPEELDGYFPELAQLVAQCQFSDCTHRSEPGCAVRQAVAEGKIHPERYQSYLRLRY
ncbi:MAG TPA: ribosome small subunit-dependent GTPase A, partial [Candidatus Methylomirabilis sp.]|nr:ribosome small subunit-dependent GTPase A [Candidatus Methylomirabilis sp.]